MKQNIKKHNKKRLKMSTLAKSTIIYTLVSHEAQIQYLFLFDLLSNRKLVVKFNQNNFLNNAILYTISFVTYNPVTF